MDQPKEKKPQEKPLKLVIDELQLEAANLTFTDDVPAKKAVIRIAPLSFKAKNLSTVKDAKGDIDLFLNVEKRGRGCRPWADGH